MNKSMASPKNIDVSSTFIGDFCKAMYIGSSFRGCDVQIREANTILFSLEEDVQKHEQNVFPVTPWHRNNLLDSEMLFIRQQLASLFHGYGIPHKPLH